MNKIDWGLYINEGEVEEEDNQRLIFKQQLKSFKDEEAQGGWRAEANKKLRNRDNEILITFGSGFSGQLKQEST